MMDSLLADFRYGARMLLKNRAVTLVAVVSLAAGIGANTAVFSILNAALFQPRPLRDSGSLVQLYLGDRDMAYGSMSWPSYLDLRERNTVLSDLAAYGIQQFRVIARGEVEQIWGEAVSPNYFSLLGVQLQLGRPFDETDIAAHASVAVIGHQLWQRAFGGDTAAVGRTILLNRQALTIVGVAPRDYAGLTGGLASEVWVPGLLMPVLDPVSGPHMLGRNGKWLALVGRLKPGTSVAQARAAFEVLGREMHAAHPDEWSNSDGSARTISLVPESQTRIHPAMRLPAWAAAGLLFAIVNLVLLVACMNLAGVLLARAVSRRGEIAVRMAMGASRRRIVRQLLAESVLLAAIAGAAGMLLATWLLNVAVAMMPALPEGIRIALDPRLDWRVATFTLGFTTLTGILFGLAPALTGSRADVAAVLKDESGAGTVKRGASRLRTALLVGQVAGALLLLIGAGLVLRSLDNIRPARLGYKSELMVVAPLALDESWDRDRQHAFYDGVLEKAEALPGVRAVSLFEAIPGGFLSRTRRGTEIEGVTTGGPVEIDAAVTGPGYFTNMGVPVVAGRDFNRGDRDGAPCVAIVNRAFAQRYFSGASPIGRQIRSYEAAARGGQWCAIVGMIDDAALQSLEPEVRPLFALPVFQASQQRMMLLVHAAGDPGPLVPAVRAAIRGVDAGIPVADVHTLEQTFSVMLYPFRIVGALLASCGVLALLLATIGIHGVVAYSVETRRRELGIRVALGAAARDIVALVVRQGMKPVTIGLLIGLALGLALTRVLASLPLATQLLFGVAATDVISFVAVTLFLSLSALAACYLPARKAARVEPAAILRT